MEKLNQFSKILLDKAFLIHKNLGPGLLESVYQRTLYYELKEHGLDVKLEVPQPLIYKGVRFDCGYRIDLLVENKLVVELKVVNTLHDNHRAQLLTYLRLGDYKLGLLLNFMESYFKKGIKRIINT